MTPKLIISVLSMATAVLISFYHREYAEEKLLRLFEHNANRSLCSLCLGNDSLCDPLDFQLDYKRYLSQYSSHLYVIISAMIRLFYLLTDQQNDQVFFGTLRLNNGSVVSAVAKSPGHFNSEMFEQTVDNLIDVETITDEQWSLLPFNGNSRSLNVCSKHDMKSNSLLHRFLGSVVNNNDRNDPKSWRQAWTAAHLSVELLVLKVLNGYRYAPNVYGACGRVYFVEDCGHTLQYHLDKLNLINRLLVAKELLQLAIELTDGSAHPNYSFYLTDITADNIAIQIDETSGLLVSLKIIDWSDTIVFINDHYKTIKNDNFIIHVSEHVDCGQGCLTYSKENICQADFSDHNIYAVCKEFLSTEGKLLHEITDLHSIKNEQEKELESLFEHCLWHLDVERLSKKSRLDTAKLIISKIQHIL